MKQVLWVCTECNRGGVIEDGGNNYATGYKIAQRHEELSLECSPKSFDEALKTIIVGTEGKFVFLSESVFSAWVAPIEEMKRRFQIGDRVKINTEFPGYVAGDFSKEALAEEYVIEGFRRKEPRPVYNYETGGKFRITIREYIIKILVVVRGEKFPQDFFVKV